MVFDPKGSDSGGRHGIGGGLRYAANGITEVIESKRMEPVFYVNDDPVVRAALEARATKSH
jgi:hypothetical protein